MKIYSNTDIGLVRETNQDACAGAVLSDNRAWAAVCDGMGGAAGGNIASSLAVQKISENMSADGLGECNDEEVKERMSAAISEANAAIYSMARQQEELRGMGTTVVLAVVREETILVAHAGDSRAYLISPEHEVRQITVDHSMVQELLDKGDLTEEQAQEHPQKNIITRALGVLPSVEVDYSMAHLPPKARLLICTDGLSNSVSTRQISELSQKLDAQDFCDELIVLANDAGGRDNITVVVIEN